MIFPAKVALARAAAAASRRTRSGGGTSLPGKLLLGLAPDALERLAAPLAATCVISATNGKTTTAKMTASILAPANPLCRNAAGANLASGIASSLLTARQGDLGLFEVDEAALEEVAGALAVDALVLGNLFRDQLDRYGELELVGERWRRVVAGLPETTTVAFNTDDPLVSDVASGHPGAAGFGIEDTALARGSMQHASDSKWCARCGTRYVYDAVFLGHLGHWRCPACGWARPRPAVRALDVRAAGLAAAEFYLDTPMGGADVRLPVAGLYNVYNALAAATGALALGIAVSDVAAGLERFSAAFGRGERIELDGRAGLVLLIKNPAGANEVLRTLTEDPEPKTLLVALNDRIADGRDVSWIWDVDFEELAGRVERVVTAGTRAAEMAMRLKYAGVEADRIVVEPGIARALDAARDAADGPLYLLPTYTAMLELRRVLADQGLVRPFWEAA